MLFLTLSIILVLLLFSLFSLLSKYSVWEKDSGMSFECGFSSSFSSRFSFSMHFFTIGIVFLFLDLELCFVMPFLNESCSSITLTISCFIFVSILLMSLVLEWMEGELEWKF